MGILRTPVTHHPTPASFSRVLWIEVIFLTTVTRSAYSVHNFCMLSAARRPARCTRWAHLSGEPPSSRQRQQPQPNNSRTEWHNLEMLSMQKQYYSKLGEEALQAFHKLLKRYRWGEYDQLNNYYYVLSCLGR